MKTALKHYNQTTRQDFDQALKVDPFEDSVIAKNDHRLDDAQDDAVTAKNDAAQKSRNEKNPGNKRLPRHESAKSDPYGTRTRVAGVKGRSPRPLDEGAVVKNKETDKV